MDISDQKLTITQWEQTISSAESGELVGPIDNVRRESGTHFDVIFVGGGGAGRFGAAYAKARGLRQLVIDKWPFLGGSCPHQACVPHHLFSEAAREMDYMRWNAGTLWFPDFDESRASITDLIELFKAGRNSPHAFMNWQSKEQLDLEYLLNTSAEIIDKGTVRAGDDVFTTDNLVLGTGARAYYPPEIDGLGLPGVYDSATLIDPGLAAEPSRCVIIGGSKVAMEYGSFFQAAGCQTTILTRSPLMSTTGLRHVDGDLRDFVIANMRRRGIEIIEGCEPLAVLGDHSVSAVQARLADGTVDQFATEFVLLATGERPDTTDFVDILGIEVTDEGFVAVDNRMRTSVPGVYAIGDLIGAPMEMFKARKSGMTAARNIAGEAYEFDSSEYPDFLHTTYEVSWVGLTEDEARHTYGDITVIQMPPKGVSHDELALPMAEGSMLYGFTRPELSGFQKCIYDNASRRLVGAHHCGFGAKDAFQYLDHLIKTGVTIDQMGEMNELFLNSENFIHLSRLLAGRPSLGSGQSSQR